MAFRKSRAITISQTTGAIRCVDTVSVFRDVCITRHVNLPSVKLSGMGYNRYRSNDYPSIYRSTSAKTCR